MLIEAVAKGLVTSGKVLKKLKDNPTIIHGLSDYAVEVEKLVSLPLKVIDVKHSDITPSYHLRQTHGLFVNDSINLACAFRFGISDVVTRDADFTRVAKIKVWEPTDV